MVRALLLLLVLATGAAAYAWYDYDQWLNTPIAIDDAETTFTIERGWSARQVSEKLVQDSIIDKPYWFDVYSRISNKAGSIKSGEFVLSQGLTPPDLFAVFVRGQTRQYRHSIIEGDNWRQVRRRLANNEQLVHELGNDAASAGDSAAGASTEQALDQGVQEAGSRLLDPSFMSALGYPELHPEGQFFADTYRFPKGTTDIEFLQRAKRTLDRVLEEEWEIRADDLPLESAYEALILASIVEKETAVASERPLIAGVFMSRLRKGMRLQTDPTVIYGIGPDFDGNIRRRDLQTDTPYNTYTRAGLPPTPIAMVGREAINAVLHPTDTKALYFVSKGDGTHQFSETLEAHNAAVRKYQLGR